MRGEGRALNKRSGPISMNLCRKNGSQADGRDGGWTRAGSGGFDETAVTLAGLGLFFLTQAGELLDKVFELFF